MKKKLKKKVNENTKLHWASLNSFLLNSVKLERETTNRPSEKDEGGYKRCREQYDSTFTA